MGSCITVRDLKKYYDEGLIKALDGLTLDVDRGEFVAIIGPSGSGKSTLLHMLGGLDAPDSGTLVVEDIDLAEEEDLAGYRRRVVGFVFQLHNLIPSLTALENVQVPLLEMPMSGRERAAKARQLLAEVGLEHRGDNLPTKLSGGERQRVAIARALVNDPKVLIADEPTGAVDSANSERIMELFRHLQQEHGMTLILVTHDPIVAAKADRIVKVLDGRIVEDGEVKRATRSAVVVSEGRMP